MQTIQHAQKLAGCVRLLSPYLLRVRGWVVRLWVRSEVQLLRLDVSHLMFLGKVELGVFKLDHC